MPAPLHVVILAAGEGKRMRRPLPKVLQPIAGQADAGARDRHRARAVAGRHPRRATAMAATRCAPPSPTSPTCTGREQAQQLGTGHAVQQAMPDVPDGRAACWCCTATCR